METNGKPCSRKSFGLQGVVAALFDDLDDPLSLARLTLNNEHRRELRH